MKKYDIKNDKITLKLYDKKGKPILYLEDVFGSINMDEKEIEIKLYANPNQFSNELKNILGK